MTKLFGDEVPGHLEFQRFDGNICCSGLPIVRFTSEERLDEIVEIHEDNGCPIFNPHRYTLEEGGMKRTDEVQLAFKREADPKGLLNPGKMIAWDNPDYDWKSDKVYLFPGLQAAAEWLACASSSSMPIRSRRAINAALHDGSRGGAEGAGHEVDDCDLYAENFDPRLTREERIGYHDVGPNIEPVEPYVERLRRPKRWCSPSGLELRLPGDPQGLLRPRLPARRVVRAGRIGGLVRAEQHPEVAAVCTYGGSRFRAILAGDPPRKAVKRVLRAQTGFAPAPISPATT